MIICSLLRFSLPPVELTFLVNLPATIQNVVCWSNDYTADISKESKSTFITIRIPANVATHNQGKECSFYFISFCNFVNYRMVYVGLLFSYVNQLPLAGIALSFRLVCSSRIWFKLEDFECLTDKNSFSYFRWTLHKMSSVPDSLLLFVPSDQNHFKVHLLDTVIIWIDIILSCVHAIYTDCMYEGVVRHHGDAWSPGPCIPECRCKHGHVKCSKLECPDLNCDKPIKRKWKCCPECLPGMENG